MTRDRKDVLFASLVLAASLVTAVLAFGYSAESSLFPRALSGFLAAMAVVLLLRRPGLRSATSLEPETPGSAWPAALLVFGSMLVYVAVIRLFNIELATLIFAMAMMRLLGYRRWIWIWNSAAGLMLIMYLVFFQLLDVVRPPSVWF